MEANVTKVEQMIVPEVMAQMIQFEFDKALKFTPLAEVDNTLVGQPGDTITMPKWGYVGDAVDVAELGEIPIGQLTSSKTNMTIKKAGKGVELSDEAILRGYGDPLGEAQRQIAMSIANKLDNDILAAAKATTKFVVNKPNLTIDKVVDIGIVTFNEEDFNTTTILLTSPKGHAQLRQSKLYDNTNLKDNILITGQVGTYLDAVVVLSRKLEDGEAFLIKPGAFKIVKKRDFLVESDRDILHKSTVITADQHYGVYVKDDSKIVKLTHKTWTEPTE